MTGNQPVRLSTIGGFDSKGFSPTTMYRVAQEVTGAGEYRGSGWSSGSWTGRRWAGSAWTAGTWNGRMWSGSV